MYILGLDTSTSILDVAIIRGGEVIAEVSSNNERTHSERAMATVAEVLAKAGLEPKDIDVFACTIGPGSYTGVRIGVSIALGMARGAGKKALGISSLDLMAHGKGDHAVPIIDARNGAVFAKIGGEIKRMLRSEIPPECVQIEPYAGKWAGICEQDLTEKLEIIYLGGSV